MITLTEPSQTNGFVNSLPMLHHRQMRSIERGDSGWALDEVLTMSGVGFESGQAWKAEASFGPLRLALGDAGRHPARARGASATTTCRSAPAGTAARR